MRSEPSPWPLPAAMADDLAAALEPFARVDATVTQGADCCTPTRPHLANRGGRDHSRRSARPTPSEQERRVMN